MNAASNLKPRKHAWVVAQSGHSWRLDTLAQALFRVRDAHPIG
jgi:hypothetical protein